MSVVTVPRLQQNWKCSGTWGGLPVAAPALGISRREYGDCDLVLL